MRKRVEVAAGVIFDKDGRFLLGQRAPDTFYPGFWEFPGGKVEAGESAADALVRELDEELGIRVRHLRPWITREHLYEHAHVRLNFFEVPEWDGELRDRVHSALSWESVENPGVSPMLPANGPILKALRLPRRMGITQAREVGVSAQLAALRGALRDGLRLVQVREPGMARDALKEFVGEVLALARPAQALVFLNGDPELAQETGVDGIHLPSALLRTLHERPALEWVGASCHNREELERAGEMGLDYALLGSVLPTATHPGQAALGWERFAELVKGLPMPVFALGGMERGHMECARDAGAHGIAAIRASWS